MLPSLFLRHLYEDQLNKSQKKKKDLGDGKKHAARCEVCVGERKQTWQWRETPHGRRGTKNEEDEANSCQRCTEFSFPFAQKNTVHCISSVQRCGTDCCCDQKGQTQLSLLRLQKSHKPQKENHPCPWRQLKRADMFELRRNWMNLWNNMALRCSSGQLPAVGCFHRGRRLNSRERPFECAQTWAVRCRVSGMRRPQTRLCLWRDKGILYAVVSSK